MDSHDATRPRPTYDELLARVAELERGVAATTADEASRASALQLRAIIELIPTSMAIVAMDGTIECINRRAVETFGYPHDEIRTMDRWWLLAYPDEAYRAEVTERWMGFVHQAIASGGEIERAEYRVTCRDGAVKTTQIYGVIVGDKVFAMFDDINERKRTDEELHDSKALLVTAFNNSPLSMTISDLATGRYLEVNDTFCRLSEFSRDEAVGRTSVELGWVSADERARMLHALQSGGMRSNIELNLRSKSGKAVVCRYWGDVIETAQGGRVFSAAEDVTERKAAEAELRETNRRLSAVVGGSPIGIVVSKIADGTILDVNEAALRLYGYAREEAIGRTAMELGTYARATQRHELMQLLREHGKIDQYPVEFRRSDGEVGVLELSGSLMELHGERCLLTMLVDVTARKHAEQAKAKLADQLQQAQKMESVGRLAGGVAHDFNNMLGVIIGRAELALARVDPTPPLREHLEEIRAAARHSADLTRQLLAFARRQTVAPQILNLNDTVAGMLAMLQRIIGENVQLDWSPGAEPWPVNVDPSQIHQVLANLCVNARDAIANVGKLVIETANAALDERSCAAHPGATPGEYVRLAVSDDGCGMSDEVLAHLFEPFFTTKEVGKGTGLGLATVYGIVEQNRGFVHVRSERGAGTTFTIYLPRYAMSADAPRRSSSAPARSHGRGTILVVEDEQAVLKLAQMMLEELGYSVLAARTPGEALRLAWEHSGKIDLLMTDVVMPEMNGRELAEKVSSLHPGTRCLFMSGYTADVIAHHGVLDEGVQFLQKPFSTEDLADKVRDALQARAASGSLAPRGRSAG